MRPSRTERATRSSTPRRLFYDGNSQGGILGGSLVAVAPDLDRGVLGVPGMNYSTLLRRSVDFEPYAEGSSASIEEALCDQARRMLQHCPAETPRSASTTTTRTSSSGRWSSR